MDEADDLCRSTVKRDTDGYEDVHVPVEEQQRALHFTDGFTEWLVTLGGFIRSTLVFLFDLPITISYH